MGWWLCSEQSDWLQEPHVQQLSDERWGVAPLPTECCKWYVHASVYQHECVCMDMSVWCMGRVGGRCNFQVEIYLNILLGLGLMLYSN